MDEQRWYIIWPDGRVVDEKIVPPRPWNAKPAVLGTLTPYYDLQEHKHRDGSYHVLATSKEQALERLKQLSTQDLPVHGNSNRLPISR